MDHNKDLIAYGNSLYNIINFFYKYICTYLAHFVISFVANNHYGATYVSLSCFVSARVSKALAEIQLEFSMIKKKKRVLSLRLDQVLGKKIKQFLRYRRI